MRKNGYYNVAPRYTGGSPGLVDRGTAERVALDESRSYDGALTGVYGEADERVARQLGLRGVVEYREEVGSGKRHGWNVLDLCTGETFFRSTPDALLKLGWRSYHDLPAYEQDLARQVLAARGGDHERRFFRRDVRSKPLALEVYEAVLVAEPGRVAELSPWASVR